MAHQPVPTVTSADVDRIVRRDFSGHEPTVLALLNEYESREPDRVRLAVLKLSSGSLERLQHFVEVAKEDYRNVLAWAEYPASWKAPSRLTESETAQVYAADWWQYQQWLNR